MQCVLRRLKSSQSRLLTPASNPAERYALIHRYFTTLRLEPTLTRPTTRLELHDLQLRLTRLRSRLYSNSPKDSYESIPEKSQQDQRNEHQTTGHSIPENWSPFYKRLARTLPHATHRRPTGEELLKVADGVWTRAMIRFKWFTIRSFRRFGVDDVSAFVTWFLMSQTLWILIGT